MKRISTFLAVSFVSLTAANAAPRYQIVEISGPRNGSSYSVARHISDSGHVVGEAGVGNKSSAFVWTQSGGFTDLGNDGEFQYSTALGTNKLGQVVGRNQASFRWSQANGMQPLSDVPGGHDNSTAVAINDLGTAVGWGYDEKNQTAALWSESGVAISLGRLVSWGSSAAVDINNVGQVVGNATGGGGDRAFYWTADLGMTDLGSLGGTWGISRAASINNNGDVVGWTSTNGINGGTAFIWDAATGMRSLGTPDSFRMITPEGINDQGVVVGRGRGINGGNSVPWIWSEKTGFAQLGDLIQSGSGWTLEDAYEINNSGQIVGYGRLNGVGRAFLLNPIEITAVPEPGTWALMIAGFGMIGAAARRKRHAVA
jgi:probable HAF family extracellular repeat protein